MLGDDAFREHARPIRRDHAERHGEVRCDRQEREHQIGKPLAGADADHEWRVGRGREWRVVGNMLLPQLHGQSRDCDYHRIFSNLKVACKEPSHDSDSDRDVRD